MLKHESEKPRTKLPVSARAGSGGRRLVLSVSASLLVLEKVPSEGS